MTVRSVTEFIDEFAVNMCYLHLKINMIPVVVGRPSIVRVKGLELGGFPIVAWGCCGSRFVVQIVTHTLAMCLKTDLGPMAVKDIA
jgi:hypothetical protein